MSQIEWKESFSVNHAEIDVQHKKWIDIHNRIDHALLESNIRTQTRIIENSLQTILDYTGIHFKYEEEFMHNIGYPDIAAHVRMHKDFDTLIYIYYRSASSGEPILNTRLLKIIKNWILKHALVEDKKYCLFADRRVSSRPAKAATQPRV